MHWNKHSSSIRDTVNVSPYSALVRVFASSNVLALNETSSYFWLDQADLDFLNNQYFIMYAINFTQTTPLILSGQIPPTSSVLGTDANIEKINVIFLQIGVFIWF